MRRSAGASVFGGSFSLLLLSSICLVVIIACGIVIGASVWQAKTAAPPERALRPRAQAIATPAAFHTEQEWIVYDVVTSIAAITSFEPGSPLPKSDFTVATEPSTSDPFLEASFVVTPTDGGRPERLVVAGHIWAPETFTPFARARIGSAGDLEPGDDTLLEPLLTPTPAVLIEQDRRIASRLAQNPDSALAQGQAALLVGAFALREYAGYTFTDLRAPLDRLTAHLAIARALRNGGPTGATGTMAEVVSLTLSGLEANALAALARADAAFPGPAERAWSRALRMRLTRDWRPFSREKAPTLLERVTYARTVREHVSDARFLEFVDRSVLEPLADWPRVITGPSHYSIESGHMFVDLGLKLEEAEQREVWSAFSTESWKVEELNAHPQPGGVSNDAARASLHVLDWGLWASFLQRQLAAQLSTQSMFLQSLGLQDEARHLPSELEERYGMLTLYPVVLRKIALDEKNYRWAIQRAQRMPVAMITPRAWRTLQEKPDYASTREPFPSDVSWFNPLVPAGSAFDLGNRSLRENCERPAPIPQIARWVAARPFDEWAVQTLVWRNNPGIPSMKELRQALGPLLEYDLSFERRAYGAYTHLTGTERAEVAEHLCRFDDDYCAAVAENLVNQGHEQRALAVYERWRRTSRDRVGVANRVRWMVRHYLETNRSADALAIAEDAYHVYSGAGIYTYAEALEWVGRYDEAERAIREMAERYNEKYWLGIFLLRKYARTSDAIAYERAREALAETFPDGLERPPVDALPAPPVDGIAIHELGARASRIGLKSRDVIVMVEGIRVRKLPQYYVAVNVTLEPKMDLVVWRDNRYQRLKLHVPERWFGVRFEQYGGRK